MFDFKLLKKINILVARIKINEEIDIEVSCFRKKELYDKEEYQRAFLTDGIFELFVRKNGKYKFFKDLIYIHKDYFNKNGILFLRKNELLDCISKIKKHYKIYD